MEDIPLGEDRSANDHADDPADDPANNPADDPADNPADCLEVSTQKKRRASSAPDGPENVPSRKRKIGESTTFWNKLHHREVETDDNHIVANPSPSHDIATDDSKDPDDTTISDDSTDQDYTTADDGKDPDDIATDDSSDTDHITISDHSNDPNDITTDDSIDSDDIATDDSTHHDHITISDDSNDQYSNGMALHQEHIVFSVKFFKCKACRKWYRSDSELQEHLKTCDNTLSSSENKSRFSGKKLARERQLNSHKKSNHRARLKCEKCGASYSTKGNLARHDKLHHPSSGVRRFPGASMYHLLQRPSCATTVKVHRRQSIPREWRKMEEKIRRKMQMERKLKLEIRMKVLTKYRMTYGHQGHDHGKHRRERRENSEMICQGHLWIYKCYHCSKRYKHRRHLENHMQDHDKQQE